MDFADANLLVDARPILAGRLWGSHRATNGYESPLLLRRSGDDEPAIGPRLGQITRRRAEDRDKPHPSQRRNGACAALPQHGCNRSSGPGRDIRHRAPASRARRWRRRNASATQARPRAPIAARAASLNENKRMSAAASAASSSAGTRSPVMRSSGYRRRRQHHLRAGREIGHHDRARHRLRLEDRALQPFGLHGGRDHDGRRRIGRRHVVDRADRAAPRPRCRSR